MARFFQPKKKTSLNTKHLSLTIEKMDHKGSGIAYQNKKPVFVDGVLPSEDVVVQLIEEKSKFARARLIKLLKPSEKRITPFCPHYEKCGGCDLQHLSHEDQVAYKESNLSQLMTRFARVTRGLEPTIISSSLGYRRRARVSLLWNRKERTLEFGFRQKQSKQIAQISDCAVLAPELNQLLPELKSILSKFHNPETLGHVELVLAEQRPIIVLRYTKGVNEEDKGKLIEFAQRSSATLYLMPTAEQLERVVGHSPSYAETGMVTDFEPTHFIQVNKDVNQKMVQQALNWLDLEKDDHVLDLFCGVGNFSLPMAKQVKRVVGVEGIDEMVAQATYNADKNQLDNVKFYQANLDAPLSETSWGAEKFAKILLDPARAGAQQIVEQLSSFDAKKIVYVSCNPATLARDSQILLEQGYNLEKLAMLDMFPHTGHLESMALFVRK